MDDKTAVQLVYIQIAPNREKIIKAFRIKPFLRPTELSEITKLPINRVSYNLQLLRKKKYVLLLNPNCHRFSLYRLTEKGEKILDLLD